MSQTTKPRGYIAGPMTGMPDWNFPAFHAAAEKWRENGWEIENPAETDDGDTTKPREYYMRLDLEKVMSVDAVIVLPAWENSKGAKLEIAVAREIGIAVIDSQTGGNLKETSPTILAEASNVVDGARRHDYGHPRNNHNRTAKLWSAYMGFEINAEQVCWCMILTKCSRDANHPKRDNLVDTAGYARNIEMIREDTCKSPSAASDTQ